MLLSARTLLLGGGTLLLGVLLAAGPLLLAAAGATAAPGIRVLNPDAHYAEGPVWYRDKLYYVEYDRNTVTTWDGTQNRVFSSDPGCGQSAVIPTARGELLTTCYDRGTIGRLSAAGRLLAPYRRDKDGHVFVGPNDFAPDGHGGIYFTTSGSEGAAIDGKVFYIAANGAITQEATDLHNANGLAVAPDGKVLYVVETEENRLLQFNVAPDATLSGRRVFVNLDELTHHVVHIYPDGVKIDTAGQIYIGQNCRDVHAPLAGEIFVVDATGRLLRTLDLPSPGVPNLAFSPDEHTIYVTALDQIDAVPHRGKVYAIANPLR